MLSHHHRHAPRHLATASYPCSPCFAQPPVSPRQLKQPLVQLPMLTFDQPCSSLSSCLCESLNTRAVRSRFTQTHLIISSARASYCCGADLLVPCMKDWISSRVRRPSLFASIALKTRS